MTDSNCKTSDASVIESCSIPEMITSDNYHEVKKSDYDKKEIDPHEEEQEDSSNNDSDEESTDNEHRSSNYEADKLSTP